ncbi:MAG: response regulator [Myxococcales bacterium]|nr:response regulator [Myxococcales bacterium]
MTAARILVVEDEGIVALDIQRTLARLGFDVTGVAASADEALAQARSEPPDLVLMDIHLRGARDGVHAAEDLRAELDLPVVYLTAHSDVATVQRAKLTEPLGYVVKPYKSAELLSVIEIALHRSRVERRLREREHLLATTLASIGDAVLTTDTHGKVEFANGAAEKLLGVPVDAMVGREVAAIALGAAPLGELVQTAITLRHASPIEALTLDCAGRTVSLQAGAAPVADKSTTYGAVLVLRDVTELRQMRRQLEFSDRLAALGTLAAGVAHEINNPLTFVTANLDFVRRQLDSLGRAARDPDALAPLGEALLEASFGADRVAHIVSELRLFARPEPRPGPTRIENVLRWCIAVAQHEIRPRARLVVRFGVTPLVIGDETRLGQVFLNLLVNAAHAIPAGKPAENLVSVETIADADGGCTVTIVDTGAGMTADVAARVFEPFFTTKRVGQGTGLGLSVSHAIVTALGGRIELESRPGCGTTFRVHLRPSTETLVDRPAAEAVVVEPGRILVVDDEPFLLATLRRTLNTHHVTTCSSVKEARAVFAGGARFDVVLCDLQMPHETGMDLYRDLQVIDPVQAERVLFLTGGAFTEDAAKFVATRPERVIHKPFDPKALRARVAQCLTALRTAPSG